MSPSETIGAARGAGTGASRSRARRRRGSRSARPTRRARRPSSRASSDGNRSDAKARRDEERRGRRDRNAPAQLRGEERDATAPRRRSGSRCRRRSARARGRRVSGASGRTTARAAPEIPYFLVIRGILRSSDTFRSDAPIAPHPARVPAARIAAPAALAERDATRRRLARRLQRERADDHRAGQRPDLRPHRLRDADDRRVHARPSRGSAAGERRLDDEGVRRQRDPLLRRGHPLPLPERPLPLRLEGFGIDISAVGQGHGERHRARHRRRRHARDQRRQGACRSGFSSDARSSSAPSKAANAAATARQQGSVARRVGAVPTILVVEDESSIASFVALYLKNAGYAVKTAATGGDALAQVALEKPALVVLDLMLPDIDGIEVCKRIRQTSDLPILMLTARDEDIDKIIGLEVGADDYLTKPFNPRELVARIKSVLRRATLGAARARDRGDRARRPARSTRAATRCTSATRRSSSRRRSSTCSGSCSTTAGSC